MQITAEAQPGTFVPVDVVRWASDGKVQVVRRREIEGVGVFGVFFAVPIFKLICSDGRPALAKILRELPQ